MLEHLSFVCNVFYLAKYLFKFVSAMLEKWLAISKVKFMSLVDSFGYNLMKAIFYHSSCKFHYLNTPISETNLLSKYLFYGSTFAIFLLYRTFSSLSIFLLTLYYYANNFFFFTKWLKRAASLHSAILPSLLWKQQQRWLRQRI